MTKAFKNRVNIPMLRRIQKRILEEPKLFFMADWQMKATCGTACCIGGHALAEKGINKVPATATDAKVINNHKIHWDSSAHKGDLVWKGRSGLLEDFDAQTEAAGLLGLTVAESRALFVTDGWPEEFRERYSDKLSPTLRAHIAVARIDHFIETGE